MANDQADAGNTAAALAVVGLVAAVVGVGWVYFAWPEPDTGAGKVPILLALSLTAAGGFALMAAIVAWAVRLGIQWSGLRERIVHDVLHPAVPVERGHLDEDGL